jgi:pyroglutamyl-peptidase
MESALLTGFAGYGGRGHNPSGEVARALDGKVVAGLNVAGRVLPVSYATLRSELQNLLTELKPRIVISLGMWPGEPAIRLERIGINVADFEIHDNEGAYVTDAAVSGDGSAAMLATLPLRAIETSLLAAGIPARISATAGTFLCNATLYTVLDIAQTMQPAPLCGFMHVPYLPEQVADLLRSVREERKLELHQRADLASMALATMIHSVELAIAAAQKAFA